MKLSDYIASLQEILDKEGNVDVVHDSGRSHPGFSHQFTDAQKPVVIRRIIGDFESVYASLPLNHIVASSGETVIIDHPDGYRQVMSIEKFELLKRLQEEESMRQSGYFPASLKITDL